MCRGRYPVLIHLGVVAALSAAIDHSLGSARPKKPLLVVGRDKLSYGATLDCMSRLYSFFEAANLKAGDRVVIVSEDDAAVLVLFLALLRAGLTAVIGDKDIQRDEFWRLVDAADPRAVFLDAPLVEAFGHQRGSRTTSLIAIPIREEDIGEGVEVLPLGALLKDQQTATPPPPVSDEAIGLILFTSGTTSRPKGVQLTHGNLHAQLQTFSSVYGFDADSRIVNVLPLHHVDGLVRGPLAAIFAGGSVHRVGRFRAHALPHILSQVRVTRATHFVAVPSLLTLVLHLGANQTDCFRGKEFQFVISSAGLLDVNLWRTFEGQFGVRVVNAYGLTETVCDALFCGPGDDTYRMGTIGKPAGCEVRVVDDGDQDVRPGETGELLIRGPIVMTGYFRQPEETAAVLVDGWFRTGDLVRADDEQFFEFVGRKKNVIKSRGVSVHPENVTAAILSMTGVADAVTIGLPAEASGELIVSCVVAEKDAPIDELAVLAHCRTNLSPEKRPSHVFLVDELPRGPAGKFILSEVERIARSRLEREPNDGDGNSAGAVYAIAAGCFKVPAGSLLPELTPFNTEGWDSIAHLDFILTLEKSFGIELSPADILNLDSLADAERIVRNRAGALRS